MHGEVFGRCDCEVIPGIVALQSGDISYAYAAGEERVFDVGLLAAAPARVAKDVQVRRPEIEPTHNAGVPSRRFCTCLMRPSTQICAAMVFMPRGIEGRSQSDGLRILGHAFVDHSMQGLAPPLIRRNIEAWNCCRVVLHFQGLLGQGQTMDEISGTLLGDNCGFR